jgi:hypothetical protein
MDTKFIESLSPSKIHFLTECKYRYVLNQNNFSSKKRIKVFNKNTFLGILMHLVLENYLKRKCVKEEFDQIWEEILNSLIIEFNIDASNVDLLKYHLPFYIVKKNILYRFIISYDWDIDGYILETEKEINGGLVQGKADIIFDNKHEKKVKIVDLKTGPTTTFVNGEIDQVKNSYKFQLLTYGYVYWLNGYKPENISCVLQGISNDQVIEMVFSNHDYQNHEIILKDLKTSINQSILEGEEASLAEPNSQGCIYCEFNYSCMPLHESINKEVNYTSLALIHQIYSETVDLDFKVNLIVNKGDLSIFKVPINIYNSIIQSINEGKIVFVSGLYEEKNISIKYWTRYTKLVIL